MIAAALDSRHRKRHVTVQVNGFHVSGQLETVNYLPDAKLVQMCLRLRRPGDETAGRTPGLPPAVVLLAVPRLLPVDVQLGGVPA